MTRSLYAFLFILLFTNLVKADFITAERAFENHQYNEAFSEFNKLAKKGEYRAQYYLGKMYLEGLGTIKDEKKGVDYLIESADKKYDSAQALLAYLYEEGRLLPQDRKKAVSLYQEAATSGNSYAKFNLGLAYYKGDVLPQDSQKALEFLATVPIETIPEVGRYLGEIYLSMNESTKAVDAYRASAQRGDVDSFYSLGRLYFNAADYDSAKNFYTYAASQGNASAQYLLGMMYVNGKEIAKDPYQGYAWIKMAADNKYAPAREVQKELESDFTRSESDKAKTEFLRIQNEVMGKVDSPFILEQKRLEEVMAEEMKQADEGNHRIIRHRRR